MLPLIVQHSEALINSAGDVLMVPDLVFVTLIQGLDEDLRIPQFRMAAQRKASGRSVTGATRAPDVPATSKP